MELALTEAEAQLLTGQVIGIPTDTVYGLAALLEARQAVEAIYEMKWRASDKPLVAFVTGVSDVLPYVEELPSGFHALAERFWPGPLTIVIPTTEQVPKSIRAGLDTTGFRVPDNAATLELLRRVGPLATTSANRSGNPPALTPEAVEKSFGEEFPILAGTAAPGDKPSTIVEYQRGEWVISRQGTILPEEIHDALNMETVDEPNGMGSVS